MGQFIIVQQVDLPHCLLLAEALVVVLEVAAVLGRCASTLRVMCLPIEVAHELREMSCRFRLLLLGLFDALPLLESPLNFDHRVLVSEEVPRLMDNIIELR